MNEKNPMNRELPTFIDEVFSDRRFFEYYLQRLRSVVANRVRALRVVGIRDVPDPPDGAELPAIEVVIRIAGLKLRNPATSRPLISSEWLRQHFEAWPGQESYWLALADYIAASIPPTHSEARLRKKFQQIKSGSPGNLPARADLLVWYEQLIGHIKAAKKWLGEQPRAYQGFSAMDKQNFLNAASNPVFWWVRDVEENRISLEQIFEDAPRSTAKHILALKFGVQAETIHSRLFRRE
jgi:hypothetical protein